MKSYVIFISAVAVLFCVALAPNYAGTRARGDTVGKRPERKSRTMGVDIYVHLFNIRTYRERVLPAYQVFLRKDDLEPLVALLRECIQKLDANPQLSERLLWNKESVEQDIGILTGVVYYSPDGGDSSNQGERKKTHKVRRDYARRQLSSNILQVLCVPHDKSVDPEQDMTNIPLISYPYEKSEWIKNLFTFARPVRGGRLELSIGESSELFTKEDIQEFSAQLDKVPPPADLQLRKEYDHLRALIKLALGDPDLALVLSVR